MNNKFDFAKLFQDVGVKFVDKPVLIKENSFRKIYCCISGSMELIVRVDFKSGNLEKIPGLGNNHLMNEYLFSFLLKKNKQVAKIIKLDQSNLLIPYPFVIYEKIIGENLATLIEKDKLSFESLKVIYEHIGEGLKLVHKVKFKQFGNLANLVKEAHNGSADKWYDYFSGVLKKCLHKVRGGRFDSSYALLKEYIEKNMLLMKGVVILPTLLHGDFEPWNIIVKDDNNIGIIDAELSFSGHNLIDLAIEYPSNFSKLENKILKAHFLKGYFGKKEPSEWESKCLDFYQDIKILTHRMVVWEHIIKSMDKNKKIMEEKKIYTILAKINTKLGK